MRLLSIFLLWSMAGFCAQAATVHCDRLQTYGAMSIQGEEAKLELGHSTRDKVAWAKIEYVVNVHEYSFELCPNFQFMFEVEPGLCGAFVSAREEVYSAHAELFAVREITQGRVAEERLLLGQYSQILQGGLCAHLEDNQEEPVKPVS